MKKKYYFNNKSCQNGALRWHVFISIYRLIIFYRNHTHCIRPLWLCFTMNCKHETWTEPKIINKYIQSRVMQNNTTADQYKVHLCLCFYVLRHVYIIEMANICNSITFFLLKLQLPLRSQPIFVGLMMHRSSFSVWFVYMY